MKIKAVTPEYVKEIKSSLGAALEKLFFARAGLALLVTTLAPTAIFVTCHFTGVRAEIKEWVFVSPVVAAVVAWLLLERRAHRRMLTAFDANAARRADAVLKACHIVWKLRGLALVLTTILLVIAAFLPLP